MMVSDIVGSVVLCGVHGAEGREGGGLGMVLTLCPAGGPCSYLYGNRLSGPIPAELGNLTSCKQL